MYLPAIGHVSGFQRQEDSDRPVNNRLHQMASQSRLSAAEMYEAREAVGYSENRWSGRIYVWSDD